MQCCELCDAAASSGCEAWTYVPAESKCWLKAQPTGSKERLGLVSGWSPRSNSRTAKTWQQQKQQEKVREEGEGVAAGMAGYLRDLLLGSSADSKGEL
jgi:hypothetical protein